MTLLNIEKRQRYFLRNNELEKALAETWKNKEKFYEENKGLTILEIVKGIEKKYQGVTHKKNESEPQFNEEEGRPFDTEPPPL